MRSAQSGVYPSGGPAPSLVCYLHGYQICSPEFIKSARWSQFSLGDLLLPFFSASSKELPCQCRRRKRRRFDLWIGKIPEGELGNPLQYSCLENPMDRVAQRATVHRVAKNHTRLKRFSMHSSNSTSGNLFPRYHGENM